MKSGALVGAPLFLSTVHGSQKNTRVTQSLPECFALSFGVDDLFGVEELLLEEVADVVDIAS